jgi:F-type H+-transporting ATPase subunit gamma
VSKVLVVAITSNRGLCGAFNSNVMEAKNRVSFMLVSKLIFLLVKEMMF